MVSRVDTFPSPVEIPQNETAERQPSSTSVANKSRGKLNYLFAGVAALAVMLGPQFEMAKKGADDTRSAIAGTLEVDKSVEGKIADRSRIANKHFGGPVGPMPVESGEEIPVIQTASIEGKTIELGEGEDGFYVLINGKIKYFFGTSEEGAKDEFKSIASNETDDGNQDGVADGAKIASL